MKISRQIYADMFGPVVGGRVRLTGIDLWLEVERDFTVHGEGVKFNGDKVIRDDMGQNQLGVVQVVDTMIANALILDHWSMVKTDIGPENGHIQAIGKAGNLDIQLGVNIAIGVGTEVIVGEGVILAAGDIDTRIHFTYPQQVEGALMSGVTAMIGGGIGPAAGTNATTCTSGPWHMARIPQVAGAFSMNIGFTGRGNASLPLPLEEQVLTGVIGLKLHEDWGSTPATIDNCLEVAERHDTQVTIHTDTLNESGFIETILGASKGRTIHTYHTESAGDSHVPNIIKAYGFASVLPSSTNPTQPLTRNAIDEHLDMLMVCHHLDPAIAEDVAFAESRVRRETIAAEDILHGLSAFSMISSDSQAMGRIGEVIMRA